MTVKDKERYTIYLNSQNVEYVKALLGKQGKKAGSFSRILDEYLAMLVDALKNSLVSKDVKLTHSDMLDVFIHYFKNKFQ